MRFADEAIGLVVDVLGEWYNPPLSENFEYGRSFWTVSPECADGPVIVFKIDLGTSGLYVAVVAPPGPTPDEATTMVWIGLREADEA
ncbi:MAG: hypothetical protein ACKVW3_06485 [Phycisphaerales bacterium]